MITEKETKEDVIKNNYLNGDKFNADEIELFDKIPFNVELAKKITNKTVEGHIVTRDGRSVRIICFDRCSGAYYPIIALVKDKFCGEIYHSYSNEGALNIGYESDNDLFIIVPSDAKYDYFIPKRMQPCVVRDTSTDLWRVAVCKYSNDVHSMPIFYSINTEEGYCYWADFLPLTKVTEHLIGTNKSYKELIKETYKDSICNENT